MLRKTFNYFSMFVTGFFFCVLGFSFLFGTWSPWNWLYFTLIIGMIVVAILRVLNFCLNFHKVERRFGQFLDVMMWFLVIILALANSELFYFLFPRLIGSWILLHALVKTITITIKIKDHLPGWLHSFIFLIGDIFMASVLLWMPDHFPVLVNVVIGCYFLIYGNNILLNFIREVIPASRKEQWDHRFQLALPPFLAAWIPPTLLLTILNKDKEDQARADFEMIKKDIPVDLEVFVHMALKGPAMLGHIDLAYRGFLFSYGCYDPHERRWLGTMGDGVLLVAPKEEYIYNCLKNENKVLVCFGIVLNGDQKQAFDHRLLEIFDDLVDFHSDEELAQAKKPTKGDGSDYLSRVTRNVPDAHFYKYRRGRFKTFFVLSSNCVFFIRHLLGSIGLNLLEMSGIVSPGSYFDFLNKQFKSNKSFVISRRIYTKRNMNQFYHERG